MEESEDYKQCHVCAEYIKSKAFKCRYCGATVAKEKINENGYFTRVILKAEDATYQGDIYLTDLKLRVSDIMNDERKFISLVNTTEEISDNKFERGFLLVNKSIISWICEDKEDSEQEKSLFSRSTL